MALFTGHRSWEAFSAAVAPFRETKAPPIPVWMGERADLDEAIRLADGLYDRVMRPAAADVGVFVGDDLPQALRVLVEPFAERWISLEEAVRRAEEGAARTFVLVGLHAELGWPRLRPLFARAAARDLSIGLLSGRDVHSLTWLVAKQWAAPKVGVEDVAFLSATDSPGSVPGVEILTADDFDRLDIRSMLLEKRFSRLLLQGHGKDDNINLGDFTVCGRNEAVSAEPGALRPRCGYGPACFKDDAKLVSLRLVQAAEVVLSSCNSSPLAGLEHYDTKYVLALNAIDGCARTIIGAMGAHDSDAPENDLWLARAARGGAPSAPLLGGSVRELHPHPIFVHYGLPSEVPGDARRAPVVDHVLANIAARAQALLVHALLPPNHFIRPRLEKLNRKINGLVARTHRLRDIAAGGEVHRSILMDVQSIDSSMAERIQESPEDDLMNYDRYFGERSELHGAPGEVSCSCGLMAYRFRRRGIVAGVPDTVCVMCPRCGYKETRFEGSPEITCVSPGRIRVGDALAVEARVVPNEDGPIRVGIFVPRYLRSEVSVEPDRKRLEGRAGKPVRASFTLRFAPSAPPQAYYFTAFAVQNLTISTYKQDFGLEAGER